MHELSIAHALIQAAAAAANEAGAERVQAVYVRVGALAGVAPDALAFCFEVAAKGTPLEGARLDIERLPVCVHCAACGKRGALASLQSFRCPNCGAPATDVVQGRELELAHIEVAA